MKHDGNLSVLGHLADKKPDKKIALVILGGVMRGTYGAGQSEALQELGLTDSFDMVLGNSTGAPIAAYFVSGQAELNRLVYAEECTVDFFPNSVRQLIHTWRTGDLVRIDKLVDVARGVISNKKLDVDTLFGRTTELYIPLTNYNTGESFPVLPTKENIFDVLEASVSTPKLYRKEMSHEGNRVVDGALGDPFPVDFLQEQGITDVLVLANRPRRFKNSWTGLFLINFFFRGIPKSLYKKAKIYERELEKKIVQLENSDINHLILWTGNFVESYERDPKVILEGADRAQKHLTDLLESVQASK